MHYKTPISVFLIVSLSFFGCHFTAKKGGDRSTRHKALKGESELEITFDRTNVDEKVRSAGATTQSGETIKEMKKEETIIMRAIMDPNDKRAFEQYVALMKKRLGRKDADAYEFFAFKRLELMGTLDENSLPISKRLKIVKSAQTAALKKANDHEKLDLNLLIESEIKNLESQLKNDK